MTDIGHPYHDALDRYRRALIHAALIRAGGNRQHAAKALGLERTYVLKLIARFGIDLPSNGRRTA